MLRFLSEHQSKLHPLLSGSQSTKDIPASPGLVDGGDSNVLTLLMHLAAKDKVLLQDTCQAERTLVRRCLA